MKIYFAAPMFAKSDLLYNQQLVKEIRELSSELSIYLPQENEAINDKTAYADSRMIALADTEKVLASDLMIALLDGLTIDAADLLHEQSSLRWHLQPTHDVPLDI